MTAVLLSPLYLLFILYLLRWVFRWFSAVSLIFSRKWFQIPVAVLYLILAGSLLLGFFIKQDPWHWIFKNIGNYWLGVLLYIALIVLAADIFRLIFKYIILRRTNWVNPEHYSARKVFLFSGGMIICLVVGISTYGVIHGSDTKKTVYEVTIPKSCAAGEELTVALVADLHLGYNITNSHMERMVRIINDMEPDLVCIAGDIFDNEYAAIKEPERIIATLQKIQSRYGVYACYGNHDVREQILAGFTFSGGEKEMDDARMLDFLERSGIRLLSDETVLIDDAFYLCGRKDYSRSRKLNDPRLTPQQLTASLDREKPILVIDHQPRQLQELAEAGVDLDMSGHTHDGQMFPGTVINHFFWENPCGLMKEGDMYSAVTSGVGLWGPNMRVGSDSEVVELRVHFSP
ncbi:MAG TPA: metallophosphoesterase [Candidatus Fimimorpha excrementavium]|nr:metallophosphoesterase [Candidatus Fimimorpha excrementavium]